MGQKSNPDYFKLPNVFVMFLIAFGMTLTAMCVYCPDKIPYQYLGFIGDLAYYLAYQRPRMIEAIWYTAVAIHVSEAIYAFYLAGQKGIRGTARLLWFIFTLGFGIGSLINLLRYDPSKPTIVNALVQGMDDNKAEAKRKPTFVTVIEVNEEDVTKRVI